MNRRLKKLMSGFLIAAALVLTAPVGLMVSMAATARISFSDPTVTVGKEFSVNVRVKTEDGNLGASDIMISYDPSVIEFVSGNNANGGAGSVRLVGTMDSSSTKEFKHTLKFKALQAGNTAISVANYEVYDSDTAPVTVSKVGSSAVKVQAPATYSSEAGLSSLKVSPGSLSPAFSPDVTSYTVNVGGDVSKIAVSANTKDGKAKVRVSGDSGLKTGANTVVCKVTAEDGQTTKSYTITVNKAESAEAPAESESAAPGEAVLAEQTVELEGVTYRAAASFDASLLPEGYVQSSCTLNGTEIMCGSGNGLTLIYLESADGNGTLAMYDQETGAVSPYVTIDVTAKSILVLEPDETVEIPSGFAETTIQLNGSHKVKGWVWESDEEQKYCVVYGMNEKGEKDLYRYDIAEKTFQRYFRDPALQSKYDDAEVENLLNEYNKLCGDYNIRFIIIVVLIVVCLILFFMVVNLLMKRRDRSDRKRPGGGEMTGREPERPRNRREAEAQQRAPQRAPERAPERRAPQPERGNGRRNEMSEPRGERRRQEPPYEETVRPERARTASREESIGGPEIPYERRPVHDAGMEEAIRQREMERAERARRARERLEQERLEDERRARRSAVQAQPRRTEPDDDDDFEFMDLD